MKIIFLSDIPHKSGSRSFSGSLFLVGLVLLFAAGTGGALWAGYEYGLHVQVQATDATRANGILLEQIADEKRSLAQEKERIREHVDALALRLGQMQSHVLRLDALGERLAERGNLDKEEFSFSEIPARGGMEMGGTATSVPVSDLVVEMEQLSQTLQDREHKLELMQGLIVSSEIRKEMTPAGRPVKKGWISSRYGNRKDPFTGKKAFHRGVDIAGKANSEVISVASGVVSHVGKKSGFGDLVEIRHADGYVTRYAHNNKILVKAGDLVAKGQVIALMGSSGRSTGPHVHFEIARAGKTLNPAKYLKKIN